MVADPRPRVPGTYFTRSVRAFIERAPNGKTERRPVPGDREGMRRYRSEPRDPTRTIVAAELSCAHVYRYQKELPGHSKVTTLSCDRCGSTGEKSRRRFVAMRTSGRVEQMVRAAIASPEKLEALCEFIVAARCLTTFQPRDDEQELLYERLIRSAQIAWLLVEEPDGA